MSSQNTMSSREKEAEDFLYSQSTRIAFFYSLRDELHPSPTGTLSLREAEPKVKELFKSLHLKLQMFSTEWKPHLSSELQAEYHCVMGKLLFIFDEHGEEAEDNLQKAVTLNPNLAKAWFCLSLCDSKRELLVEAKEKLEKASKLGARNFDMIDIACEKSVVKAKLVLAMLKGNAVPGIENESMEQLSKECIEDAKQAASYDLRIPNILGKGWYCLGNAYLINWFATGCGDFKLLSSSRVAFDKVGSMGKNPYCRHNLALASKYHGDYASALEAFQFAAETNVDAAGEIEKIVSMLKLVKTHSTRGGQGGTSESKKNYTLQHLREGLNEGRKLLGKVKCLLKKENGPLLHFLLSDPDETNFVLSISGVCENVIHEGDQLMLQDPYFRNVNIPWEQEEYNYNAISMTSLSNLLLNKKPLKEEEKTTVVFENSMRI